MGKHTYSLMLWVRCPVLIIKIEEKRYILFVSTHFRYLVLPSIHVPHLLNYPSSFCSATLNDL